MGTSTRITSKGQVTIPKEFRERLGVKSGDAVEFQEKNGEVVVRKKATKSPFDEWHGYLKDRLRGKRTDEIIREMRGE
jgi:AbrB family looped-hinge helix DNA binding protein